MSQRRMELKPVRAFVLSGVVFRCLKALSLKKHHLIGEQFTEKCYLCGCQREKSSDKGALAFWPHPKYPPSIYFKRPRSDALFSHCLCRDGFFVVPITSGRRDDVSSTVFLMGLLAGASGGCREATESPRLFCLLPSLGG